MSSKPSEVSTTGLGNQWLSRCCWALILISVSPSKHIPMKLKVWLTHVYSSLHLLEVQAVILVCERPNRDYVLMSGHHRQWGHFMLWVEGHSTGRMYDPAHMLLMNENKKMLCYDGQCIYININISSWDKASSSWETSPRTLGPLLGFQYPDSCILICILFWEMQIKSFAFKCKLDHIHPPSFKVHNTPLLLPGLLPLQPNSGGSLCLMIFLGPHSRRLFFSLWMLAAFLTWTMARKE